MIFALVLYQVISLTLIALHQHENSAMEMTEKPFSFVFVGL